MKHRQIIPPTIYFFTLMLYLSICVLTSCRSRTVKALATDGDTIPLKYAQHLVLVKHDGFTEALVLNPWNKGTLLHRYFLVPKGQGGNQLAQQLASTKESKMVRSDVIRTPITRGIIFTSAHCQLMYELGCPKAIAGVCDLQYINISDIQKRSKKDIVDCGQSFQPNMERIVDIQPEALLVSPFENNGGFGKLEKLKIPVIETADYMETSPLGRAEWIRFYGLLFGSKASDSSYVSCTEKADSIFNVVEQTYLSLKKKAAALPLGASVLTERKTGGVWYVPGGKSTMGILLRDAHARYEWAEDSHSGSLALNPEQVLDRASNITVWALKRFGGKPLTRKDLLDEYKGYVHLAAMTRGKIYQCDTSTEPYFEETSFHPERLLREFILLSHPEVKDMGRMKYYKK